MQYTSGQVDGQTDVPYCATKTHCISAAR